jgi:hypothetical protein
MHRPVLEYPPNSVAAGVSVNLSRALASAGVTRKGVRPASLREYAANRTYAISGGVEEVAELLGVTSLDTAARFVDPVWQDQWGEVVRSRVSADE